VKFKLFPRKNQEQAGETSKASTRPTNWLTIGASTAAVLMLVFLVVVIYQTFTGNSILSLFRFADSPGGSQTISSLPNLIETQSYQSINRRANLDTNLPQGFRKTVVDYTIELGDSIFGVSKKYSVKPESILWANYAQLNDDPQMISIGTKLLIPPVDGILYEWQEGDTLNSVSDRFKAKKEDILLWPGNNLDITNPVFQSGALIMIPGGYRALKQWVVAVTASNQAGVNAKISGPGSCTPVGGAMGSGSFIWPTGHQGQVSGNDYWEGHRALDMMCYQGDAIFASDSGVVIYRGSIGGGYGNLVAIDHGNGWLTLYAHLSSFNVACGQSVSRGQVIAACGNTGNSTGAHLHFEVRKGSSFYNPWQVFQ
jgi:murein DD-endopeptidase MepM/ murein hydrolase activator NlpD